ncbi:MAG: beta-galactosidase GalB [Verrucomicrobiota bacterium]
MSRLFALFLLATALAAAQPADVSPRSRISLDAGWRFQKGDPPGVADKLGYSVIKAWMLPTADAFLADPAARTSLPAGNPGGGAIAYAQPDFDDRAWRELDLPHDWAIEGPFVEHGNETGRRPYWGVAWYRKSFDVPTGDAGRQIFLEVDGAMSYATVWINGQCAGGWPYGYASFQVDLTPFIHAGQPNVLAIRLDNPPDSSRWYPGAGIYRHLWLTTTAPVHVAHWGVQVTTPHIDADAATVDVRATIDNATSAAAPAQVQTALYALDANGARTGDALATSPWSDVTIAAGASASTPAELALAHPQLWDLDAPHRYVAVTTVRQGDVVVDRVETPFGVRAIAFDAANGFLFNGHKVPIRGVCMHSDLGALGTALNTRALERQMEILKEMGCNAIRTSHNPPSPDLVELCDRMGVMIMAESFDCWKLGKTSHGYQNLFDDWSEPDLRALVRHFRNDPCVILWSIGNEIREQDLPQGPAMAKRLTAIVHEEDTTRPTTIACSSVDAGFNGFEQGVDVFGYNYKPWSYGKFHAQHPNQPLFGSETSSTVSSRGVYLFPIKPGLQPFQVGSYDEYAPPWATLPDAEFRAQEQNPFVAGEFVWTGFDYMGEPTPYNSDPSLLLNAVTPEEKAQVQAMMGGHGQGKFQSPSRSSYFGIVDLVGLKKDRFYLYQAHWRPDLPMAHLLPHWNWPDRAGQVTPVYLYTSGDEAELFLNGHSLGRKAKKPQEYRLTWDVPYQPGELTVVAYKDGKEWARDRVKTTGPVDHLQLAPDRAALKADGADLAFVTVALADKEGLTVPTANDAIRFSITGPADIVAVDNGDATDLTPFQEPQRHAFNGLAVVVVRTHRAEPGAIAVKAEADGLPAAVTALTSQ